MFWFLCQWCEQFIPCYVWPNIDDSYRFETDSSEREWTAIVASRLYQLCLPSFPIYSSPVRRKASVFAEATPLWRWTNCAFQFESYRYKIMFKIRLYVSTRFGVNLASVWSTLIKGKKGIFCLVRCQGTNWGKKCNSALSWTSALDGNVWSTQQLGRITPW